MQQVLLDKEVLRPSGEIVKDKINLISGAHTSPFVEMLMTVTSGDTDMTDRVYTLLSGLYLHTGKLPDHAALILHNDVLPFYQKQGLEIQAILTGNGREYCGRLTHHHYEIYLVLNGIEYRKTRIATPKTNGFAEHFNRTVKEEFFDIALRQKLYTSIEELQKDLDERPHQGYRNMGRRPIETIEAFNKQL